MNNNNESVLMRVRRKVALHPHPDCVPQQEEGIGCKAAQCYRKPSCRVFLLVFQNAEQA